MKAKYMSLDQIEETYGREKSVERFFYRVVKEDGSARIFIHIKEARRVYEDEGIAIFFETKDLYPYTHLIESKFADYKNNFIKF